MNVVMLFSHNALIRASSCLPQVAVAQASPDPATALLYLCSVHAMCIIPQEDESWFTLYFISL